jgi:hypothetical protein
MKPISNQWTSNERLYVIAFLLAPIIPESQDFRTCAAQVVASESTDFLQLNRSEIIGHAQAGYDAASVEYREQINGSYPL